MPYQNEKGREYIYGVDRSENAEIRKTHLYDGNFSEPGLPLCKYGWNRPNFGSYSIWRNRISERGICKICKKRERSWCLHSSL